MGCKPTNLISVLSLIFVFSAIFFCQGCNDDTVCPHPDTGTVQVMCEPDSIDVPWSITLPAGLFASGINDTLLTEMPTGEYVISWGQVSGWVRTDTNPNTGNLQNNSLILFRTVLEKDTSPSGSISIEPMPLCIDPGWVLSGPNGFITDGSHGTLVIDNLEEGDYTLAWGSVPGWETPDPDIVEMSLSEGGYLTFIGVYVEKETGLVSIDPNPDSLNVSWELQGPDGFTYSGNGDLILGNMLVGDYTVIWTEVANWVTPSVEIISVLAGETTVFTGEYEINLPVATNKDILMNNFQSVYENMFFAGYESILHDSHKTIVLQSTYDDWEGSETPLTSLYLDRNKVASIHQNIFQGVDGAEYNGTAVGGVISIDISLFERLATWEPVPPSMEYYGDFTAHKALFNVNMHFVTGESSRFEVNQMISFIVAEESGQYKLLGVIPMEQSGVKATEVMSLDRILILYQ